MSNQNPMINGREVVVVTFVDPADYDARFDTEFAPAVTEAIGVLVGKKDCVQIAWLFDEHGQCEAGLAIPKGCVISIQKVGRLSH